MGGCGCAGGQVTTARDEKGRRRRATMDSLGRLKQSRSLNWDQTVYATTTYSYNPRVKSLTAIRLGSRATLPMMGMDVYKPAHARTGRCQLQLFRDDSVANSADARGATVPSLTTTEISLPASHTVCGGSGRRRPMFPLVYDAAGNRTSMTDGMGW